MMSPPSRIPTNALLGLLASVLILAASTLCAQESVRLSLAGAEAARARREDAARAADSDLRLGPTLWSLRAGVGFEFTDNLYSTPSPRESDLVVRPQVDVRMRSGLSDVNALHLSASAGYAIYTLHPKYSRLFVAPGSELSLDLYVGNCWLNLHDRVSIQDNPYLDPTVTGIADYQQFENAAGLSGTWDLNKLIVKLAYDHLNYAALGDLRARPDAALEVFSSSIASSLLPGTLSGIEAGTSLIRYDSFADPLPRLYCTDGLQWNLGVYCDSQISDYISVRGSLGYTAFAPRTTHPKLADPEFSGLYLQLAAVHRVNKHLHYTLNGGRMLNFSAYAGQVDHYYASIDAGWNLIRNTTVATGFRYQHGAQEDIAVERYDWFGPNLVAEHVVSIRTTATIAYSLYWRGSNQRHRDYRANVISLRLSYKL